jgi:hypothetical protein
MFSIQSIQNGGAIAVNVACEDSGAHSGVV